MHLNLEDIDRIMQESLSDALPPAREREVVQWIGSMSLILQALREAPLGELEPLWYPTAEEHS